MEKNQGELPHVGNMISEFMKARFISQSETARSIGVTPSQMSKYMKSPTLQTHTLWKFCVALEHDFFSDLAKKIRPTKLRRKTRASGKCRCKLIFIRIY